MTRSFYETEEFLSLRDEWYQKLADSGFEDIEILDEITHQPGHLLRGPSSGDLKRSDRRVQYVASQQEYYRLAGHYVWTLPRGPERHVARLHAEGLSDREVKSIACKLYPELQPKDVRRFITHARKAIRRQAREGKA